MFYDDEIASTVQTDWEAWTNGKWDIEPERINPVAEFIFANEDEIEFTYEERFFTPDEFDLDNVKRMNKNA